MKFLINQLSRTATKLIGSNRNDTSKNSKGNLLHDESVDQNYELIGKWLEVQESVELDPAEQLCLYEWDLLVEDDHHQEIKGRKGINIEDTGEICTYEQGSWEMVVSKPALCEKRYPPSFCDLLSYWKSKEKEDEAWKKLKKKYPNMLVC